MSLATAGIGGGAGGVTQAFNINMPAPISTTAHTPGSGGSACNDGCCGPSGPDLSMMAAATSKTGNFRGEISGSQCLSIDLGEDTMAGAVWSEKDFTVTSLRDAMSIAVSISKDGNKEVLDFLESPSEKVFDSLKGISFGSSAESKKSSTSDIVFPTRYIGQENDPSSLSLYSLLKEPTTSFSKSQALRLSLPNSSIGETVSLHPEELVALQLQYWAGKARAKQQTGDKKSSIDKKNKKKQKFEKGVTLVVPGYYGQRERNVAKLSATMAGLEVQHVFSRGLCATAASLLGPKANAVHSALKCCTSDQPCDKSVVVLFVHVNSHGVEVSLVECERPLENLSDSTGGSRGGTNAMYYDRLICLASGGCGGELDGVSGMSVLKYQSDQPVNGNTTCCGGKGHNHDHHNHNESKGNDTVDDKSSDYDSTVMALIARVVSQQLKLANLSSSDISLVLHSGRGSPKSLRKCFEKVSSLARLANTVLLPVPEEDAAKGGAILTAAELDSSKQYIEVEEDHSILVHSLSIAEDVMSTSIGMLYVESEDMENSLGGDSSKVEGSIQCIYPAGTIIRKVDVGPVRKHVVTPIVEPKEFSDGTVNFFGSHCPSYHSPTYPKLLLVQLEPQRAAPDRIDEAGVYHWRPVTDVGFPLLSDNGRSLVKAMRKLAKDGKGGKKIDKVSFQKQALLSCKINFRVNESHGLLTLEHAQGHKVMEKVKAKSQIAKIAYTVGFVGLLVVLYFAYGIYVDNENHRQDVEWLTEFYEKHAPKKLEDPKLVEDTLMRYKDKLFVLWRKLEKTYDVKVAPPQRIMDSNYEF